MDWTMHEGYGIPIGSSSHGSPKEVSPVSFPLHLSSFTRKQLYRRLQHAYGSGALRVVRRLQDQRGHLNRNLRFCVGREAITGVPWEHTPRSSGGGSQPNHAHIAVGASAVAVHLITSSASIRSAGGNVIPRACAV